MLQTSSAIRALYTAKNTFSFRVVSLSEPPKAELIPFLEAERLGLPSPNRPYPPRITFAHYYLDGRKEFYRAYVDVSQEPPVVISNEKLPYSRHAISDPEEMVLIEKACLENPKIKKVIAGLSIPPGSQVVIDPQVYSR